MWAQYPRLLFVAALRGQAGCELFAFLSLLCVRSLETPLPLPNQSCLLPSPFPAAGMGLFTPFGLTLLGTEGLVGI